jgi:hypothetical protein
LEDGIFILLIAAMVLYFLVLWAHSLRRRLGLAHFYALLGGITAILPISGSIPAVDAGGITFMAGSTVFYTSLLLGVFVLYLFDGPRAARNAIFAIVGISVIVPAFLIPIHMQIEPAGYHDFGFSPQNLRSITVSVFAILINLVFLAIAWEFLGASSTRLNLPIRIFLTLLGVMWLDAVLFTTGAYAGTAGYLEHPEGKSGKPACHYRFCLPLSLHLSAPARRPKRHPDRKQTRLNHFAPDGRYGAAAFQCTGRNQHAPPIRELPAGVG